MGAEFDEVFRSTLHGFKKIYTGTVNCCQKLVNFPLDFDIVVHLKMSKNKIVEINKIHKEKSCDVESFIH